MPLATAGAGLAVVHHDCEFCQSPFLPRVQTRRPRACTKKRCQIARQRRNEHEWRQRFQPCRDAAYHAEGRRQRHRRLKAMAARLAKAVEVGGLMLGEVWGSGAVEAALLLFLRHLGIRAANKLIPTPKALT